MDIFTQQIQDDSFTIENFQNILFLLKELLGFKARQWKQETINQELDNTLNGMSKKTPRINVVNVKQKI